MSVEVAEVLDSFREDFRKDIRSMTTSLLAPIETRLDELESDIKQLRNNNTQLKNELKRWKSTADKATANVGNVSNGGESAITEADRAAITDLRRQVDCLATRLGDVAESHLNKAEIAHYVATSVRKEYARSKTERQSRADCVILRGLPEKMTEEELPLIVRGLAPSRDGHIEV
eukprot:scpid103927/ scgid30062/ 